ncbi:MAG: hypothetical protein C4294_05585, partial [Nitrospiraceae bacterium]
CRNQADRRAYDQAGVKAEPQLFVFYCCLFTILLFLSACGITSQQRIQDDAITRQVKDAVLSSKKLNLSRIQINTEDDVLHLTGKADSSESKLEAEQIARQIPGVK